MKISKLRQTVAITGALLGMAMIPSRSARAGAGVSSGICDLEVIYHSPCPIFVFTCVGPLPRKGDEGRPIYLEFPQILCGTFRLPESCGGTEIKCGNPILVNSNE